MVTISLCGGRGHQKKIKAGAVNQLMDEAIKDYGFGDCGKLLLLFYAADKANVPVTRKRVGPYAYLMGGSVMPDTYIVFQWQPLPDAERLGECLTGLEISRYLKPWNGYESPVEISKKGRDWVENHIKSYEGLALVIENMSDELKRLSLLNKGELFDACFEKK